MNKEDIIKISKIVGVYIFAGFLGVFLLGWYGLILALLVVLLIYIHIHINRMQSFLDDENK